MGLVATIAAAITSLAAGNTRADYITLLWGVCVAFALAWLVMVWFREGK